MRQLQPLNHISLLFTVGKVLKQILNIQMTKGRSFLSSMQVMRIHGDHHQQQQVIQDHLEMSD